MRGHGCTSSPMPLQTRVLMSSTPNTILVEEHSELAKKEPNSVVGTGICQPFTIGSTFVSWHSSLGCFFKIIFPGLLYDAMKDQYKVISDGEKVESGSWSDSPYVLRPFFPNKIQKHIFSWLTQMVSSSLDRTKMSWRVVTTGEMILVHQNGT